MSTVIIVKPVIAGQKRCPKCNGTGKFIGKVQDITVIDECYLCKGTGSVSPAAYQQYVEWRRKRAAEYRAAQHAATQREAQEAVTATPDGEVVEF